ncbi:alpha/beta fold hydrolase [Alteromonas sp. CYL-A6]|uniref:alpha/beta fold hydrolase n=1 Tax=Alteromonas nitratireducens TaxID=3390813 RepID=UPI0034AA4871
MKERCFSLNTVTLAALDNEGEGPVIIGLHGFLDNANSLLPLMPYFHRYRFIALDLAGHGRSSHRSKDAEYNQADYLQDLHALITHEGWSNVILLGHSLGGILATLYAGLFPEHVSAVISLDSCGPLTRPGESAATQMREAIVSRAEKRSSQPGAANLERAVEARCKVSDMRPDDARLILERNMLTQPDGTQTWSSDPRVRTKSVLRMTESQAQSVMRSIDCPLLFTAASDSFKKAREVYGTRQAWFADARCIDFEGGHHVHMEQPGETAKAIIHFVEQM